MADVINIQEVMEVSAKDRFNELDGARSDVLDRARQCAILTLPYLLPPDGHTESDRLNNPYQNTGARLVNNLASKMTFTMLPPNNPFFRMFIDEEEKAKLVDEQGQPTEALKKAEQLAVLIENDAQKLIAKQALIVPTMEAMKSLIITGNALAVKIKPENVLEKGIKVYRLDNYVVQRDFRGNLLEVVTKEMVSPHTLPDDILTQLDVDLANPQVADVGVYTRAVYKQGKWYEYQYVEGTLVEGSDTTYTVDSFPYMALRTTSVNGHNYGLGIVTQHLGDFISLESANQLIFEANAIASRTLFGKKPGSTIDIEEVNGASNGSVVIADFDNDLTVMRVEKHNDLVGVVDMANKIERRLEQVFLSANSAVRDSERTTLGEIRYLANDLEQAQGGLYSLMSQEYQSPLARLLLSEMDVDMGEFTFIPVTGVEALGRNSDLEKLRQFSGILQETPVLQESISKYFNVSNYIEDVTTASSLPQGRYIKTPEQMQQEQQAMQEQQLLAQSGGALAQSAGKAAGQQMVGGQPQ